MQAANHRANFANGPVDCSALAAAEHYSPTLDAPIRDANGAIDWDATADYILAHYPATVALWMAGACMFLANVPGLANPAPAATGTWCVAAARPALANPPLPIAVTREHVLSGGAILLAGKVNYWKINHHTGTAGATGYVAKICRKLGIDTTAPDTLSLIWRACHWVSTRVALAAMGVQIPVALVPAPTVQAITAVINMPDDAIIRIRSNPAGTAGWCDVWAGIVACEAMEAATQVGPQLAQTRATYEAIYAAITAGDATYHMGARYLTGNARIIINPWPNAVINWVYTTLKYFDPKTTLLDAVIFRNASEDPNHITYFRAYATAMSKIDNIKPIGLTFA